MVLDHSDLNNLSKMNDWRTCPFVPLHLALNRYGFRKGKHASPLHEKKPDVGIALILWCFRLRSWCGALLYFIPEDDSSMFFNLWRAGSALRRDGSEFSRESTEYIPFSKFPLEFNSSNISSFIHSRRSNMNELFWATETSSEVFDTIPFTKEHMRKVFVISNGKYFLLDQVFFPGLFSAEND